MTTEEKVQALADRLREEYSAELNRRYGNPETGYVPGDRIKPEVIYGKKYARIDIEHGHGHLMVDMTDGRVYGIKGYGQVHKGRYYGTLDTIDDYVWGEYSPYQKRYA